MHVGDKENTQLLTNFHSDNGAALVSARSNFFAKWSESLDDQKRDLQNLHHGIKTIQFGDGFFGGLVGSFSAIINYTWHDIVGLIRNLLYIVCLRLQRYSFRVTAVRQTQVKIHAYSSIFPLAGSPLFSRIICYKLSNEGCRLFISIEFWQGKTSKIQLRFYLSAKNRTILRHF